MLKETFGDACVSYLQAMEWHKSFRGGQEEIIDEAHSERSPPTSRMDEQLTTNFNT